MATNLVGSRAGCHPPAGGTDQRKPLREWLRDEATWRILAAARVTHPLRVKRACGQLWPTRYPYGIGPVRTYSWPELEAIAAHLSEAER